MDYSKLDSLAKEGTSAIGEKLARLRSQTRKVERYDGERVIRKRSKGVKKGIRRLLAAQTRAEHRERNIAAKTARGDQTRDRRKALRAEREYTRDGEVVEMVDRRDPNLPILEVVIHQPWPGATINYVIKMRWDYRFNHLEHKFNHRFFTSVEEARDLCDEILDKEDERQQIIRGHRKQRTTAF